ncbi:hypothetical protein ABLE91_06785 [Aquabacter sp. CN5-332]|uniref:hypothetical protein n=1 Tax=Aquabacter sp. CN5-332 TaxID=3156608 RepID=UPI0032B48296
MDPKEIAKRLAEELSQKSQDEEEVERAIREMSEAVIKDVIIFIDELDKWMKLKNIGSVERFYRVNVPDRMLEIELRILSLGREKSLRFGVQKTKIFVALKGENTKLQPSGPVYTQKQVIDWISKQVMG